MSLDIAVADKQSISEQSAATTGTSATGGDAEVLFMDPMTGDWRENWFLDGEEATVRATDQGLYFAAGTVTKRQDPMAYHAHHAVLWTRQEFAGNLRISFDFTRVDDSNYGSCLLYIQAQGIGEPPFVKDIAEWNQLRAIPAMNMYFEHMNLIHLNWTSLSCRRYPTDPDDGITLRDIGFKPIRDEGKSPRQRGKTFRIEATKRGHMLTLRVLDPKTQEVLLLRVWDLSENPKAKPAGLIKKGRIGLRQMATRQSRYRNFKVERLMPDPASPEQD